MEEIRTDARGIGLYRGDGFRVSGAVYHAVKLVANEV
jgi:hypothetical protein